MNKSDAINFLNQIQPLPNDLELTQEIIDKYDEIRKYFIKNPDNQVIRLFLNSYGDGDGLGVYPLVEDLLYKYPKKLIVNEIKKILENPKTPNSVRYWVTQNAAIFNDKKLKKGLEISLSSNINDIQEAAKIALEQI